MRLALLLCLVAACFAPSPPTGAPCDPDHPCPSELVCAAATSTCERTDTPAMTDAPVDVILIDGCTPVAEVCGDGIDQDCDGRDVACVVNDLAADAIDVTAGGTFASDLALSTDDAPQVGCGGGGGREVFYKVTLQDAEVFYFDTFGSTFDAVVRVYPGKACTAIAGTPACNDDACGGSDSQLALSLPTGTSCVVVDQKAGQTSGDLSLHVIRGLRDGERIPAGAKTFTGDTCTSTNQDSPTSNCNGANTNNGKDDGFYFTSCPASLAKLDASTCTDSTKTHFDTVIYVRAAGGNDLTCVDDTNTCTARPDRADGKPDGSVVTNVGVPAAGLYWLILDSFGVDACGGYQLDTNLH